jgi:hypothetical protein
MGDVVGFVPENGQLVTAFGRNLDAECGRKDWLSGLIVIEI